jgi:hypothetical protein
MDRKSCSTLWTSALILTLASVVIGDSVDASPSKTPTECPITYPDGGPHGNDALGVVLGAGTLVFKPGGGGFIEPDGSLGIKVAWDRRKPGVLAVGGRRLDGPADSARSYIIDGYGDSGGVSTYLVFPTPGCWEIIGRLGRDRFSFVVLVVKIGNGPAWRFAGPESDWRVTTMQDVESVGGGG